ncbi:MAG TPA: transcription elongation factor GreA [Thermomicrobiales bacterium]|jgi:transcription elongation factor GreA|nr:transcription elongation factor GreA [Chloroflexota bacterium]HQX62405.1 transcription elongation factor GreA [Thermomicrobiales bacterium]HBY45230.1 transcription elongation factor GreA [Chloroflexota bacterium]HCG30540.1 transcription elongation factor GreA [Chloroflexota bacterium]HQZ88967.1 transcription elongation factor GreA [Thermomicrobiales bacterium]
MYERTLVTSDGLAQLKAEYQELITVKRPEVIRAIAAAREEGDLRENGGYHAARHDQTLIEGRIKQLEQMLKRVEIIDEEAASTASTVRLGSTVTIDIDGDEETYTIVGAVEANPTEGRISNESPVGKALIGHGVGQAVVIHTPHAILKARILAIG